MKFIAQVSLRTIYWELHDVEIEAGSAEEAGELLRSGRGNYVFENVGELIESEVDNVEAVQPAP